MPRTSFLIWLLILPCVVGVSGCAKLWRKPTANYQTVPGDPHHDVQKAKLKTAEAIRLIEKCHPDKAEQALQEALIADVTYGPAHNNLGQLYFDQENYYLAAWEFDYARKLMPERPEPLNNLGQIYEAIGKLDKAIEFYTEAHLIQSEEAEFIGNLVRARLRKGDHSAEVKELLGDLMLLETRPEWREWTAEKLALLRFDVAIADGEDFPAEETPTLANPTEEESLPGPKFPPQSNAGGESEGLPEGESTDHDES